MINIVKKGELKSVVPLYQLKCYRCNTEFEFTLDEANYVEGYFESHHNRYVYRGRIRCPLCTTDLLFDAKDHLKDIDAGQLKGGVGSGHSRYNHIATHSTM